MATAMLEKLRARGLHVTRGFERGQYFLFAHGVNGPASVVELRTMMSVQKVLRSLKGRANGT